jgi:hypothetical protein
MMALRANDAVGYRSWLALGIEELGRDVAAEVDSEWMVPLLVEEVWVCLQPDLLSVPVNVSL